MPNLMRHTVKKGETLWDIAKEYYGKGMLWRIIYMRNRHEIGKNPDLIYEGQVLIIPIVITHVEGAYHRDED